MNSCDKYVYNKNHYIDMSGGGNSTNSKIKIIIDDPKYKYVEYYGRNILHVANNMDDDKLNENSEFMIGSISKVFTGVIILMLEHLKLLSYHDNIDKYIDSNEFNNFSGITIHDVLRHFAGFINWLPHGVVKHKKVSSSNEALKIMMQKELITKEKGKKSYSSMGFLVLGAIIENVTNMKYIDVVKKYILTPCDMKNTGLGEPDVILYKKEGNKDGLLLSKEDNFDKYMVNAGGGMYSSINDMIKFSTKLPKLLHSRTDYFRKCYGYYNDNGLDTIRHNGSINGGLAEFSVSYTKKWKIKKITIKFSTNVATLPI